MNNHSKKLDILQANGWLRMKAKETNWRKTNPSEHRTNVASKMFFDQGNLLVLLLKYKTTICHWKTRHKELKVGVQLTTKSFCYKRINGQSFCGWNDHFYLGGEARALNERERERENYWIINYDHYSYVRHIFSRSFIFFDSLFLITKWP